MSALPSFVIKPQCKYSCCVGIQLIVDKRGNDCIRQAWCIPNSEVQRVNGAINHTSTEGATFATQSCRTKASETKASWMCPQAPSHGHLLQATISGSTVTVFYTERGDIMFHCKVHRLHPRSLRMTFQLGLSQQSLGYPTLVSWSTEQANLPNHASLYLNDPHREEGHIGYTSSL